MANVRRFKSKQVAIDKNQLLLAVFFAFLLAVFVHAIVLSIKFIAPEVQSTPKEIEVSLIAVKAPKPPKRAKILAQENQISNAPKKAKSNPPKLQTPNEPSVEKPQRILVKMPEPPKPAVATKINIHKPIEKSIEHVIEKPKIIAKQVDIAPQKLKPKPKLKPEPEAEIPEPTPRPQISPEMLRMQIAQLGAQIARDKASESEQARIKSVSSITTHRYAATQYESDFIHKVERTGNLNHPEIMLENNFTGHVVMSVGIKEDGSIYSVNIVKSSGYPSLDKSAKKIVRMSAPFPPLPKALLNETRVLVITKSWSFSNENVSIH